MNKVVYKSGGLVLYKDILCKIKNIKSYDDDGFPVDIQIQNIRSGFVSGFMVSVDSVKPYTCEEVIKDIDLFFSSFGGGDETKKEPSKEGEGAHDRSLAHMVTHSKTEPHIIQCQECWDYYEEEKRKNCGG